MKQIKKLKKIRVKQGRFPDDGNRAITLADLRLLPDSCHLSCPKCSKPWFGIVSATDGSSKTECVACGWVGIVELHLCGPYFNGVCSGCGGTSFALMKLSGKFGVGCQKCNTEYITELNKISKGGIYLGN